MSSFVTNPHARTRMVEQATKNGRRTQTVFSPSQCIHVWAQQEQDLGQGAKGSVFFRGRFLWSYETHFVMGFIAADGSALLNATHSSVTTNKHLWIARDATNHRAQYFIPDLTELLRSTHVLAMLGATGDARNKQNAPGALRLHIHAHPEISDDSACYLAGMCGVKNPSTWVANYRAKLAREAAAVEAAGKVTRRKELRDLAKRALELPNWAARQTDVLLNGYGSDAGDQIKRAARDVSAAAALLKKEGRTQIAKRLQPVAKQLRERAANFSKIEWAYKRRKELRLAINSVRTAWVTLQKCNAGELDPRGAAYLSMLAIKAEIIGRECPTLTPRGREYFRNLFSLALACEESIRAEKQRREFEEQQERRAEWLQGQGPSYSRGLTDGAGGVLIRAKAVERDESGAITDGDLETSQGASVPLPHAVRVFRFLKLCRERGEGWRTNGHSLRVGHFRVDSIEPDGSFQAGCHRINWREVERLARELGVFAAPAADTTESTAAPAAA